MTCGGCNQSQIVTVPQIPDTVPRLLDDGSIEFPGDLEILQIEGYELDPNDDRKLIPVGAGCIHRMTGVMLQKSGTYGAHHVCMHKQCPYKSKPVTFKICEQCPFRE